MIGAIDISAWWVSCFTAAREERAEKASANTTCRVNDRISVVKQEMVLHQVKRNTNARLIISQTTEERQISLSQIHIVIFMMQPSCMLVLKKIVPIALQAILEAVAISIFLSRTIVITLSTSSRQNNIVHSIG